MATHDPFVDRTGIKWFIGPSTLQKAIEFESKIQTRPVLNLRALLFLTMPDKMVPDKMFDADTED
jgi:hypothetical protein